MKHPHTLRTLLAVGVAAILLAAAAGVLAAPSGNDPLTAKPAVSGTSACDRAPLSAMAEERDAQSFEGQASPRGIEPEPKAERVVGQVVAVDAPQGIAMLATQSGVVALRGEPETIADLDVGDVVVVEVTVEAAARIRTTDCI